MDIRAVQDLWDIEHCYLDTATYGLPPGPVVDAIQAALGAWQAGEGQRVDWETSTEAARASFGRLIGAARDDVAVGSTASEFMGLVAASLPSGSRVVTTDIEFSSALWPWLAHADRGIEVVTVPVDRLAEAVNANTTVVAFSIVQSMTGEVVAFDDIAAAARSYGALVVVDATQACGWLPLHVRTIDVLVCSAYKWLMSPRGSAFFYLNPELRDRIRPLAANWYAGEDIPTSYYGPPLRLACGTRRFDISPAWFCWVGTQPALELIEALGVDAIHDHDVNLANRFRTGLGLEPGNSAIVSVTIPGALEKIERAGIRAAVRGPGVRASFHLYTTERDVDTALDALT
ncbi:MAG: aminotransferase class V-fold PLP-dependent enzyme [Chloroflexota bacterium]